MQVLEKLALQDIEIPLLDGRGNSQIFIQINDRKEIMVYYKAPVKVSADGANRSYKEHTFDILFFSELYHYLRDPVAYFRN